MTDELKAKLREVVRNCDVSNNMVEALSEDEAIAQIDQAYKDAGYFTHNPKLLSDTRAMLRLA